jgi:hypothetical protein
MMASAEPSIVATGLSGRINPAAYSAARSVQINFEDYHMTRPSPDSVLQLRLSTNLLQQLDRAASALETSRSEYVRRATREALLRDAPLVERFA